VSQEAQGPFPDGFAEQLARLLVPEDRGAAAAVVARVAELEDDRLTAFLEALTARIDRSPAPISAAELDAMVPRS
jgi:hypothetical protein